MEFVDIAGLVEGASQGEGLGNQFLAHIRDTQAIAHLVRCFRNDDIVHIRQEVDPRHDIDIINTELCWPTLTMAEKTLQKHTRKAHSGDKEAHKIAELLRDKILPCLEDGTALRNHLFEEEELIAIRPFSFLTLKPMLYVLNHSETNNVDVRQLEQQIIDENSAYIKIDIRLEAQLAELDPEERADFLRELGIEQTALSRFIQAGYKLLKLHNFFTAGPTETRAWTIPQGTRAQEAAGVIHSDFARFFIRAEVISYIDFIDHGGEQEAKKKGLWRLEGKDYVVQDGDVIHFRTNA